MWFAFGISVRNVLVLVDKKTENSKLNYHRNTEDINIARHPTKWTANIKSSVLTLISNGSIKQMVICTCIEVQQRVYIFKELHQYKSLTKHF